jgi:hypothetical protein
MKMIGFAASRRDPVDVDSDQERPFIGGQDRAGLFNHLAPSRIPDLGIIILDVPAGQEPSVEAAVMNQKKRFALVM